MKLKIKWKKGVHSNGGNISGAREVSKPIIHITFQPVYRYAGWTFEFYRTKPFPPHPLNKYFEPRKRVGRAFWKMYDKFSKLSVTEQERYKL